MRVISDLRRIVARVVSAAAVLCAASLLLFASTAQATPVTYTGFTVTDGKLGSWSFHNARIYLVFRGDTSTVQDVIIPQTTDPSVSVAQISLNTVGTAEITVVTAEKSVHANFAPGQIFVSLDQGDPNNPPLLGGRGIGFGSFSATAAGGLEPAYPLGLEDGNIDWGDIQNTAFSYVGPALKALPTDLSHNTGFSGRAWICVGFPDNTCPTPVAPLKTDRGDLFLYQPYQQLQNQGDTLQGGFVISELAIAPHAFDTYKTSISIEGSHGITYTGALLSSATLGGKHFDQAQIYLSFDADSRGVESFVDATSMGYINKQGRGRLKIISGGQVIQARFAPGQLYAYSDTAHGSAGIGSVAGGRGYPFSITSGPAQDGDADLVGENLIGAITDILNTPADAALYTPATATVSVDLRQPTVLFGGASSCTAFDPATSICSNLAPVALKTDRGDFYIYEPYVLDQTAGDGTQPYSVNWGTFWAENTPGGESDR